MNQHPKAKALGLSPLKVSVGSWLTGSNGNLYHLHDGEVPTWKAYVDAVHIEPQIKNEADIMADALNTMNQYGHTPSEMVEIIRELRAFIEGTAMFYIKHELSAIPDDNGCPGILSQVAIVSRDHDEADELLTKTEDFR